MLNFSRLYVKHTAVAVFCLVFLCIPVHSYAATTLRLGHYGDEVQLLQGLLLASGFDPGPIDGIFGKKTELATVKFQAQLGLDVDGIVGPITWKALGRTGGTSRGSGPLKGKIVVIDPGHGGPEPGAIGYWGDKEKDFTLPIALKVSKYLQAQGASVVMTRYGDYTPGSDWSPAADDLWARVSVANSQGADLFISVHINAYPKDPTVSGVMGFYRSGSWSSRELAAILVRRAAETSGLAFIDVQEGPFYVLNRTYMPAALLELGFMTNQKDVELLRQNWFQDALAKGLAQGISEFLVR